MKRIAAALSLSAFATIGVGSAFAADFPVETPEATAPLPSYSAIFSLWGGGDFLHTDDGDFDERFIWAFGADGRFYHEYTPGRGWQLEAASVVEQNADAGDEDSGGVHVIAGGHWIARNPGWAWGAFAAASHTVYQDTGDAGTHLIGGLEAAMFTGMTVWYGQVGGHIQVAGDDDTWTPGLFGKVGGRHYFTEDSRLEANVAFGGLGQWDPDDDAVWAQWGVEYEHRLFNWPLSGFVAYQGDLIYGLNGDSADRLFVHAVKVGVRLAVGGPTLMSLEQGAGTFKLPDLHVPFSFTDDLL